MTDNHAFGREDAGALVPRLRVWWETAARDLPWRGEGGPAWGILVSEVMSQQTPMSRVAPYWTDWMRRWPTPGSCAAASKAEILTAWGNLGYPSRALRLRACAQTIVERFGGSVPQDYGDLVSLPGVGRYTASAVLSFAFGKRVAVVDTNIRRVVSRAFDGGESIGGATTKADLARAVELLPREDGDSVVWNQTLMEIGATVCTSSNPRCRTCPLAGVCRWKRAGYPGMGAARTRSTQKWKGTDRQVRGIVLKALRRQAKDGVARPRLAPDDLEALWPDSGQLRACVAALDADGLVAIGRDGGVTFPD